jgi:hypothetical protein
LAFPNGRRSGHFTARNARRSRAETRRGTQIYATAENRSPRCPEIRPDRRCNARSVRRNRARSARRVWVRTAPHERRRNSTDREGEGVTWFSYRSSRRAAARTGRGEDGADAVGLGDGGVCIARARALRERTAMFVAPARSSCPTLPRHTTRCEKTVPPHSLAYEAARGRGWTGIRTPVFLSIHGFQDRLFQPYGACGHVAGTGTGTGTARGCASVLVRLARLTKTGALAKLARTLHRSTLSKFEWKRS